MLLLCCRTSRKRGTLEFIFLKKASWIVAFSHATLSEHHQSNNTMSFPNTTFQFSVSLIERTHWEQITSTANPLQCYVSQEAFQSLLSSKYPNAVLFQKNESLVPSQAIMFWVNEIRKQTPRSKSHPSNLLLMILPVGILDFK